jgi:hypothetical protein
MLAIELRSAFVADKCGRTLGAHVLIEFGEICHDHPFEEVLPEPRNGMRDSLCWTRGVD